VSRSGESRSDDLPAPSAIYPLHHGLGTLNRDLLAPIVRPGLPLPYHVPWRRRRRNETPDTPDHPIVFSHHRPRRGEQAQRRPRQPVHGRATTSGATPMRPTYPWPSRSQVG